MTEPRDFYAEAVKIVKGETLMVAEKKHLIALYDRLEIAGLMEEESKALRLRRTNGFGQGQHRATAQ